VVEAVAARVVEDVAGFGAEVVSVAAASFPDVADLLRDAVAWDTFSIPARFAAEETACFHWDWPAYIDNIGTCPQPRAQAITVQRSPCAWAFASTATEYLDSFLTLGWAKKDRVELVKSPAG
jgi:hypothetical protein